MAHTSFGKKKPLQIVLASFWTIVGAFLAALAIQVFLYPNALIDGGVIGIALILGRLTEDGLIPVYLILLNLPFIYLAYRFIRRNFVIQMSLALIVFSIFLLLTKHFPPYHGEILEVIVLGGAILGIGSGLIIRYGGCTDGSEILGIIANKKFGFTVGQVVLFFNFFVFTIYGLIFLDWHIAVQSLLTYIVAFKMIDLVIIGLEEIKEVTVISKKSEKISKTILDELGLGLTMIPARGGFSGEERFILTIIVERLDLSELKELILNVDPDAFLTVSNIYEVVHGRKSVPAAKKSIRSKKRRETKAFWSS